MTKIHHIIKETIRSEFYQDIFKLFTGTFVARIIPALFALIIARLYAPSQFGNFVLYLTIGSFLSIVSTGKYESALLIANNASERKHLFKLTTKLNFSLNAVFFLLFVIWTFLIQTNTSIDERIMLLLIPVYSFFFANIQVIRNLFISQKQFKRISFLEITRAIIIGILQCLFFILPNIGLFLGVVLAQVIIYIIYAGKTMESKGFSFKLPNKNEISLAKRYINFPKFSVLSEAFNFLSSQLPIFLIKPFFGGTVLGLYSFPHRYLNIPVQLTSKATSSVYVEKAQALKNKPKELSSLTLSLFKRQFVIGIIPFTIMTLWGMEIFTFVFGEEWSMSGILAQIVSPWLFTVFLGSPLSSILLVREKQKVSMKYNILLLLFRACALILGGLIFKDIYISIGLFSAVGFLFFVFLCLYSLKLANVSLKKVSLFALKITATIVVPLVIIKLWL